MLMNSVFVAGTLVLNLVAAGATTGNNLSNSAAAAQHTTQVAVTDSFAPAPRRKPAAKKPAAKPAPAEEEVEEEAAPPPPRRPAPTQARRRPPAEEEEAASEDEEEEEDKPRVKRRHKRVVEEEEEEDEEEDAPMASMASVIPRLFSGEVGAAAIGRNFAFNTQLQKESTFPRLGLTLALEAFPLLRLPHGWYKRFGAALTADMEFGAAALQQSTGASISYPVSQRRIVFDVRYAILAGERVVILPAIGLGTNTFDLKTNMPTAPSACNTMSAMPCLADIATMFMFAGLHLRIALTEEVALSVGGGYLQGLSVGKTMGSIGSERTATMTGYQFEVGGNLMLKDWLAVRAAIPFTHYGYKFTAGTATYSAASETYYGLTVSALVFTR